jgi:hypothetical protein
LKFVPRPGEVVKAAHVVIDVPALLIGEFDEGGIMRGEAHEHASIAKAFEETG